MWLINTLIVFYVISIGASFALAASIEFSQIDTFERVMSAGSAIINLGVLFTFRDRLALIIDDDISGVLTFFGGAIYHQYKINEAIDWYAFRHPIGNED